MSADRLRFPEYGDGGDQIGSRRARHAFRFCIISCMLFTLSLWFCENFWRYERSERLYLRALTQDPSPAQVFLHNAIRLESQHRDFPSPKYLQALAERQKGEQALETYQRAYQLDPDNAALALRYGCRLVREGRGPEAEALFQQAVVNDPANALPLYLEAAVVPWVQEDAGGLRKSLTLIAKANSSGKRVTLPRPLWFSGLSQDGFWYANLQREIVEECCLPFYRYLDDLTSAAEQQIAAGRTQYWDSWLEKLQGMGANLAAAAWESPMPGAALLAETGLRIQLEAVRLRAQLHEVGGTELTEVLHALRPKLEDALGKLDAFEENRRESVAQARQMYLFPLKLASEAIGVICLTYLLSYVATKLARARKRSWTLGHSRLAKTVLVGGAGGLVAMLLISLLFERTTHSWVGWMPVMRIAWRSLLAGIIGFGAVYPALILPRVRTVARKADRSADAEQVRKEARRRRRIAYLSFLRRYYGTLFGFAVVALSVWIIAHRVLVHLYPWEIKLLASGFAKEEAQFVANLLETIP